MCLTKFVTSCRERPLTSFQQKRICKSEKSLKTQPVIIVGMELKMVFMQYGAAKWLNKCGGNWKIAESTWMKNLLASTICYNESLLKKIQSWLSYLDLSGGVSGMNETQGGWVHLLCQWREFIEMLWSAWKTSSQSKKGLEIKQQCPTQPTSWHHCHQFTKLTLTEQLFRTPPRQVWKC